LIKALVTDVDGTLTDGKFIMDHAGNVSKAFNTHDFYGMQVAHEKGINIGVFTGCTQPCNKAQMDRAAKYAYFRGGLRFEDKETYIKKYIDGLGVSWDDVAFIGDEINDWGTMQKAGVIACPANAVPKILEFVQNRDDGFSMNKKGGEGCVREFVDFLIG